MDEQTSLIPHVQMCRIMCGYLDSFADLPILSEDYVEAARYFNLCRSKGIQGSNSDFLICAVSVRNDLPIYTTDKDFELFAKHIPLHLYKP